MANNKKRTSKDSQIIFELALLLPSYVYLLEQYQIASKEHQELNNSLSDNEYKVMQKVGIILEKIRFSIKKYQRFHQKAIEISNKTFDTLDTKYMSVFLIGIDLLIMQANLSKKNMTICSVAELADIEDAILNDLDGIKIPSFEVFQMVEIYTKKVKSRANSV